MADPPGLPPITSVESYSQAPRDFYAATACVDLLSFVYAVLFYQVPPPRLTYGGTGCDPADTCRRQGRFASHRHWRLLRLLPSTKDRRAPPPIRPPRPHPSPKVVLPCPFVGAPPLPSPPVPSLQLVASRGGSLADITDADRSLPVDYLAALLTLFALLVAERATYTLGS